MTIKQYLIIGALMAAALFGGYCVYQTLDAKLVAQAAQIDAQAAQIRGMQIVIDANEKASAARIASRKAQAIKDKESDAKLQSALKANPAWAAQRVPDDVAAALGVSVTPD